ncbi:MAG: hypothetical protein WC100_05025 [Sterolibacterium sp.]
MFHVLDHSEVVYIGDLSHSTQYVIEHYGEKIDAAIRSGIRILYTDSLHSLNDIRQYLYDSNTSDFCKPTEDWRLD